ncbi:MAG: hypothetical protein QXO22_04250 [Thermosphaera sp.]
MFGKPKLGYNAPISIGYLSILSMIDPCLGVHPKVPIYRGRAVIRQHYFNDGAVFIGIGESKTVAESASLFKFKFDSDAPMSFIKTSLRESIASARAMDHGLVLLSYIPFRSYIDHGGLKKARICVDHVERIPPVVDVESCVPRGVGDVMSCGRSGLGSIHVAVTPVYIYVSAGYRLVVRASRQEVKASEILERGTDS